jgi:peroxiredoxin Q/BCP
MTRSLLALAMLLLLSAFAACDEETRPDGGKGLLPVGAHAPDVEGLDAQDKPVKLSSLRGQKLALVYFYPKDETPGCTKEACALRDAFDEYEKTGVVIFGVSRDSHDSHRKFRKAHELPFPLVADESGALQSAYGVPSKLPGIAARVSFLIGKDGRVLRVWPDVDPALHAQEVLSAARTLK